MSGRTSIADIDDLAQKRPSYSELAKKRPGSAVGWSEVADDIGGTVGKNKSLFEGLTCSLRMCRAFNQSGNDILATDGVRTWKLGKVLMASYIFLLRERWIFTTVHILVTLMLFSQIDFLLTH
jgi:hypothetical protein